MFLKFKQTMVHIFILLISSVNINGGMEVPGAGNQAELQKMRALDNSFATFTVTNTNDSQFGKKKDLMIYYGHNGGKLQKTKLKASKKKKKIVARIHYVYCLDF